jgi:hypothetical protein
MFIVCGLRWLLLLKMRIQFIERLVGHPVDFEFVWIQRSLHRIRVGLYRPVVGVPEVESVL